MEQLPDTPVTAVAVDLLLSPLSSLSSSRTDSMDVVGAVIWYRHRGLSPWIFCGGSSRNEANNYCNNTNDADEDVSSYVLQDDGNASIR